MQLVIFTDKTVFVKDIFDLMRMYKFWSFVHLPFA